jgi:hypothetical protein
MTQRLEDFKKDLAALLEKYRVEISVESVDETRYSSYEEITFYSPSLFEKEGMTEEGFSVRAGRWLDFGTVETIK